MLAIGRALMSRPKLLLLDEPSLGLAPLVVKEIFAAIRSFKARGVTRTSPATPSTTANVPNRGQLNKLHTSTLGHT